MSDTWVSCYGHKVKVSDMSDQHILNAADWLCQRDRQALESYLNLMFNTDPRAEDADKVPLETFSLKELLALAYPASTAIFERSAEIQTSIQDVCHDIQAFQTQYYGKPNLRGVTAKLSEEVEEFAAEVDGGDTEAAKEELADVLFLVMDNARALGMDPDDLARVAAKKLEKNKARKWAQDENGVWSHVK